MLTLIKYLKYLAGNLTLPTGANGFFLLDAQRNEDGDYQFTDATDPIAKNLTILKVQPDDDSEYCAAARFISGSNTMSVYQSNCNTGNATVCRTWRNIHQDCSKPFIKRVTIFGLIKAAFKYYYSTLIYRHYADHPL